MGTHMPYGITQCYLPPGRGDIPAFTPAEAGTWFSDPGGRQGWVELGGWLERWFTRNNGHPSWTNHRCEKLAQIFYAVVPGRDSNPRPLDRESDALPQHHDATLVQSWKVIHRPLPSSISTSGATIPSADFNTWQHSHQSFNCILYVNTKFYSICIWSLNGINPDSFIQFNCFVF